jgi:hypothetical protein
VAQAFAEEFILGVAGVLQSDHLSGMHGCRLMKAFGVRHKWTIRKLCRGIVVGVDRLVGLVHDLLQLFTAVAKLPTSSVGFFVPESQAVFSGPIQALR